MLKRFISFFLAIGILASTTTNAYAIPNKFKNCPTTKQHGITYLLWKDCAIVTKTPNKKTITIPNKIKTNHKTYIVRNVWDNTLESTPKLKTVHLKAKCLEAIENPAIFQNYKIKVVAYDRETYRWLKDSNVNVKLAK